jgi:hypothetical protein
MRIGGWVAWVVLGGVAFGQAGPTTEPAPANAPVEVKDARIWEHRTGPEEALHHSAEEMEELNKDRMAFAHESRQCLFEVVVSANGVVESLTELKGSEPCALHEEEAAAIERARVYTPWLVDGVPARVKIQDWVNIYPPEKWGPAVAFPAKVDEATLEMELERTMCFGTCPAYRVTVRGDGTVLFDGEPNVYLPGHHTAHIAPEAVTELLEAFRAANFLSALPKYVGGWTDNPTETLTLRMNGMTKTVVDYIGLDEGLPLAVKNLESAVDTVAGTERWVKKNEDSLAQLKAEGWDFAAASHDNLALYRKAILENDEPLIDAFVRAKAPAVEVTDKGAPPVCEASRAGNAAVVGRMLETVKTVPSAVKNRCLADAAQSGNLALVEMWLGKGADPKAHIPLEETDEDWIARMGALAGAIQSGNPAVVSRLLELKPDLKAPLHNEPVLRWALDRDRGTTLEMVEVLIAAGADVNQRDWQGETPLFGCMWHPEAIKPLLDAGADLEARADYGDTVLIRYSFAEAMVKTLLEAGADPTATGRKGDTALMRAKEMSCTKCAEMIQAALNRRSGAQN